MVHGDKAIITPPTSAQRTIQVSGIFNIIVISDTSNYPIPAAARHKNAETESGIIDPLVLKRPEKIF